MDRHKYCTHIINSTRLVQQYTTHQFLRKKKRKRRKWQTHQQGNPFADAYSSTEYQCETRYDPNHRVVFKFWVKVM